MVITLENNFLCVKKWETNDPEITSYFNEIEPEKIEASFHSAVKIGSVALKTMTTTERIDYIEKKFAALDTSFSEILVSTQKQLEDKLNEYLSVEGTLAKTMEAQLGDNGNLSKRLNEIFGENGKIVKELFDPNTPGTPLNTLKLNLFEKFNDIQSLVSVEKGRQAVLDTSVHKGGMFEDEIENILSELVKRNLGDKILRTTGIAGNLGASKKGDFLISLKDSDLKIVFETKDWIEISATKIREEMREAIENRGASFGIFVSKWVEALPNGIGCFNYIDEKTIVCGLGFKEDNILHPEMLNVAYCLAKADVLKSQLVSEKIDTELIQSNLSTIKSKLKTLDTINSEIKTIEKSSGKITEYCRDIRNEISECADKIMIEIRKQ